MQSNHIAEANYQMQLEESQIISKNNQHFSNDEEQRIRYLDKILLDNDNIPIEIRTPKRKEESNKNNLKKIISEEHKNQTAIKK